MSPSECRMTYFAPACLYAATMRRYAGRNTFSNDAGLNIGPVLNAISS